MAHDVFPVVVQAVAGADFTVYAYMLDGSVHLLDMKPLLQTGGVFECLRDETFFRSALTVMNDTIAWDISGQHDHTNCIDIDPFTIAETVRVPDPMQQYE